MDRKIISERGHNKYLLELRVLARKNRNNPTKSEMLVWETILRKRYLGYKFLRQKPINRFILDFYCAKLLLAIEVDGDSHDGKHNYDQGRDQMLEGIGIKTIRYENDVIENKIHMVIRDIKYNIKQRQIEMGISPLLKGR